MVHKLDLCFYKTYNLLSFIFNKLKEHTIIHSKKRKILKANLPVIFVINSAHTKKYVSIFLIYVIVELLTKHSKSATFYTEKGLSYIRIFFFFWFALFFLWLSQIDSIRWSKWTLSNISLTLYIIDEQDYTQKFKSISI